MTRLTRGELTSGVGALVLGVGLGALVPQWFSGSAAMIVVAGRPVGPAFPATQAVKRAGSASNFVLHDFEQK